MRGEDRLEAWKGPGQDEWRIWLSRRGKNNSSHNKRLEKNKDSQNIVPQPKLDKYKKAYQ